MNEESIIDPQGQFASEKPQDSDTTENTSFAKKEAVESEGKNNPKNKKAPTEKAKMIKFSQLLGEIPESQRVMILRDFNEAILSTLNVIPFGKEKTTIKFTDEFGASKEEEISEFLIQLTDKANNWINKKRRESGYRILENTGAFPEEYNLENTESQKEIEENFEEISRSYRIFLAKQQKESAQSGKKQTRNKTKKAVQVDEEGAPAKRRGRPKKSEDSSSKEEAIFEQTVENTEEKQDSILENNF